VLKRKARDDGHFLTAKQVDKLAGRSVDDIRVNAPFLLAMHRANDSARGPHLGVKILIQEGPFGSG
jgi:hypothetical protein